VSPAIEPAPVSHRVESPERKSISLVQKQKHKPSAPQVMSLDNTGQLKRAETFWMMGEYDKSSALLQRVLSTHPDSAAAADLLKKVQRAKQAEGN
jgi:hypothetical protein